MVKNPLSMLWVKSKNGSQRFDPRGRDPREEGVATHSSILAWRLRRTGEPGGLQSMGSQS